MTWRVEVTLSAERDFDSIIAWTRDTFGLQQATIYEQTLLDLIAIAASGPEHRAFRSRVNLGSDVFTAHMRDAGLKGRHLLLLRVTDHRTESSLSFVYSTIGWI
jgi:plasmid stabilization system protein ParE